MAYRNGTYVAFHGGGTRDPTASDIRYYYLMKAWHENDDIEFRLVNSHDKTNSVRDSSLKETLRRALVERLNNSRNMVLIVTPETSKDTDWVPFEIAYAVDTCGIPIIATYPNTEVILNPGVLAPLWPNALASRIQSGTARVMHVPFDRRALSDAIHQFSPDNLPPHGLWFYSRDTYRGWGFQV